ncbi:uncharacterized protein LOC122254248 [Penaeus japonicus]|uniref:uncharacterized protein LOC122254248 n=1 Tax=Penaeus japonicus TaxID=27405 RepID=UPI001C710333|nr:uncharacterized protein LOC122254248 [Penaeus japonicus]
MRNLKPRRKRTAQRQEEGARTQASAEARALHSRRQQPKEEKEAEDHFLSALKSPETRSGRRADAGEEAAARRGPNVCGWRGDRGQRGRGAQRGDEPRRVGRRPAAPA